MLGGTQIQSGRALVHALALSPSREGQREVNII